MLWPWLQTFKKEADYYDIGLTEKEETTLAKFAALVEGRPLMKTYEKKTLPEDKDGYFR